MYINIYIFENSKINTCCIRNQDNKLTPSILISLLISLFKNTLIEYTVHYRKKKKM